MTSQLDPFQTALLQELRTEVAAREPRRTAPSRPRWAWPAAAATFAVATGTWLTLAPGASTPAYAVDTEADGDVVVRIHDVQDLRGLEQALADEGVTADVTAFDVDPGHTLVLGEELGQVAGSEPDAALGDGLVWSEPAACGSDRTRPRSRDMPVKVTHPDDYVITLDGDVVGPDSTLEVVTVRDDGQPSQLFVSYSVTGTGYCGALVGLV